MFENGRKNLCVVLCDVANHYQEQVCKTITSSALTRGYNVSYFSFFTCYGVDTQNGIGESNIINLIPYERFDGFIICHDTFFNEWAVEELFEYIEERTEAPVITLRRQWKDYPCVLAEDSGSIQKIVRHLVDVHGFRRIAFMSGTKGHPDAEHRLADYREGIESCGIPYKEELVFYGDFWKKAAKKAVPYFLTEIPEKPEAIVCANDYMAISLCNELINQGTMVPDDIVVTGFDDIWEALVYMPPMTTVAVQVEKMSEIAFDTLEKMIRGEEVPNVQTVPTEPVYRNSCGCAGMNFKTMVKRSVRQSKESESIQDLVNSNMHMIVAMAGVDYAEELVEHARIVGDRENYVRNLFICLGEGEGDVYPKYCSEEPGYPTRFKSVGSVINREIVQTEPFDTVDLLPREAVVSDPMIYFFFPLHNLLHTYGYVAVNYMDVHSCEKTFHSWIAILGNAIEGIRLRHMSNSLLDELNNLYVHDALTGLMNRRGFEYGSKELYEKSLREGKTMVVISIDMDNLKIVNDQYGHAQGDVALREIAEAMEHAAGEGDVCSRSGGDEFAVFGIGYDKAKVKRFLEKFQQHLDDFNEKSGLPYLVMASYGYYIIPEDHSVSLENAMVQSDQHLYDTKREKKAKKLDNVVREQKQ